MILKILKNLISIFILIILVSCSGVRIENSKISNVKDLTKGQVMVLVVEEKNKYEERFGTEIWNLKSGDGNTNFKDYVVSNIKTFVEKMLTIKEYGEREKIELSSKDRDLCEKAKNDYMADLSLEDMNYIDCTEEEVLELYLYYRLINLTIDELTKNSNIELSISEAKVISTQYIVLNTLDDAKKVHEGVLGKGANFAYYARQYTKDADNNISMIIKRGDEFSSKVPNIFYISTGEISEPIEIDGKYYIFKVLDDYMEKETSDRMVEIINGIKNKEFNERFDVFEKNNSIKSTSAYWQSIDLSKGNRCKIHSFYTLYNKYFNND